MGLTNLLSDIYTSLTFTEVQAESEAHQSADVEQTVRRGPEYGDKTETGGDDDNDKGGDDGSGGDADGDKAGEEAEADGGEGGAAAEDDDDAGGAEDGEEAAEEEEEDDEPVDPKPKLEEECAKTAGCAPYKNHYDECVERVMEQEKRAASGDKKGPREDCVEEFFHLTHCATQCAAPKLFAQLK